MSHHRSSFAAMDDQQYWVQRLEEYLRYRRHERGLASGTVADDKAIVGQWIVYAIERNIDPSVFNDVSIDGFTRHRNLQGNAPSSYKSHIRQWCKWAHGTASGQMVAESIATDDRVDGIAAWMERLEDYLSYLQHRGRKPSTIEQRRRRLSKWVSFACSTGRNPAVWDPGAVDEAFVAWGTVESPRQRDYISRRIRVWCQYWQGTGLNSPTLDELVQQFRDSGYPDEETPHHLAARAEFERVLRSLPSLSYGRRAELRSVWKRTTYDYGGPGVTAAIDAAVRDVSEAGWPPMRDGIYALCFGDDDVAARFDEAIASIKGLGELMATRLLAITQPQRFLPNFIARSSNANWPGKLDAVELLDRLKLLPASAVDEAQLLLGVSLNSRSKGDRAVRSNDLLLEVLRPHFSEHGSVDTWGIRKFLYWLAEQYAEDDAEPEEDYEDDGDEPGSVRERLAVALGEAARDLFCEPRFLNDIWKQLADKGQVILYGPPGTGKTYFAQRLGQALVEGTRSGDPEGGDSGTAQSGAYSLVQFHPAYSYEDFFEGFRPRVDDGGQMTYELTPGPLVRLARRAAERRNELHVMVIDEINRANLPRVLGELLYLLEYRDKDIHTQYRPDEKFRLTKNLLFIGTMNTADRSIAMIDAAMRRRFHFVPFFPDREPTAGLLRSWYERHEPGQAWIADLLDGVNKRLRGDLGGDYMLIGPSHFMKQRLNEEGLGRIWRYNIEPLIEDQLFGREDDIRSYRFDAVLQRHQAGATSPGTEPGVPNGPADEFERPPDDGIESQDGA